MNDYAVQLQNWKAHRILAITIYPLHLPPLFFTTFILPPSFTTEYHHLKERLCEEDEEESNYNVSV